MIPEGRIAALAARGSEHASGHQPPLALDDLEAYLEACRATFAGCPEANRIALYTRVAEREHHTPAHLYRLAKACLDGGSVALWSWGARLALGQPHDSRGSLLERREARIRLGEWQGWLDLDWRENDPDFERDSAPPNGYQWWDGKEDLSGKALRVSHMGGYGDAISWLRFVEPLHNGTAGQIYWDTDSALMEFAHHNTSHLPRVTLVDPLTDACVDRHLSATSLPAVIGVLPSARWSAPAGAIPGSRTERARIGLAWASNICPIDHLERTMPLSVLAPFFWRDDIEVYSLQVGERATDAYYYPNVRRPDPPLESFNDTARWMASMDGVISVDTSVAHLAGLLGIPTLLLLRFACDCRWGLGDKTPWYPSVRQIRQRQPGDWPSVRPEIQQALDARWWDNGHRRSDAR